MHSLYFPHGQDQGLLFRRPLAASSIHGFLGLWHVFRSHLQPSLKLSCWIASKSRVRARPPVWQSPTALRQGRLCHRPQKPAFLLCSALPLELVTSLKKLLPPECPPTLGALTPASLLFSLDFVCVFLRSGFVEKSIETLLLCIKPGVTFSDGF